MTITVRVPNGVTDQYVYFTAFDDTDGVTRETGLTTFTVYRSRNNGTATAMTTPTITEVDATNMPGVYTLLLDEDMSIDSANDSELMNFYITHAGMRAVDIEVELYIVPSSQAQVAAINAATGGALNFACEDDNTDAAILGVTFVGSQEAGTYLDIVSNDGTYHQILHDGNVIDIVYQYDVGLDRTSVDVIFRGYLNGGNDTALIQAYNGSGWDTITTIPGQAGSTNVLISGALLDVHTQSDGKVYIRIKDDGAATSPELFVDQLIVTAVNNGLSVGYANGSIWLDTVNGIAGTTAFVNGVADNPVSTLADAITLASNVGLSKITIAAGSSITLATSLTGYAIEGSNYDVALGGQDVSDTTFLRGNISGVMGGSGVGSAVQFIECDIANVTINQNTTLEACSLSGDITIGEAGDIYIHDCWSAVAGNGSIYFDFGAALNASNLNIRLHSGGWTIKNMGVGTGTYNATFEGWGQIIWDATCTGGSASVRGEWKITDNASGAVTVAKDDNQAGIDALQAGVNVSQIGGSATSATNLSASTLGITVGACTGVPTTTVIPTNLTETTDDHYNGRVIVFTSGNATQIAATIVDYDGTTKEITVQEIVTAPAATDSFVIV